MTSNERLILKETVSKLKKLLEEHQAAEVEKQQRDKDISIAKLIIDLYSKGNGTSENVETIVEPQVRVGVAHVVPYPSNGTWKQKIIAILKQADRVLKIKDIIDEIKRNEGKSDSDEKSLTNVISNTITVNMVKKELLKAYSDGSKGFYYGNPTWWDDNNKLKPQHLPIKKPDTIWK